MKRCALPVVQLWATVVLLTVWGVRSVLEMLSITSTPRPLILRTPAEAFTGLPGYPYEPRYFEVDGVRVHYIDVCGGPRESAEETILCVHGEPTWSYVYRKVVAGVGKEHPGWRVVALDFIGFGKSDKFSREDMYSHELHTETLTTLLEVLDLTNVTLVVQDWGGLTGLSVAKRVEARIARLVIMNTGLPSAPGIGSVLSWSAMLNFATWVSFVGAAGSALPVGRVMAAALKHASPAEIAAYSAPYHVPQAKAGVVAWPKMVPFSLGPWVWQWRRSDRVGEDMAETAEFLAGWEKPVKILFSDACPITSSIAPYFANLVPGARGVYSVVRGAGHFIQDDAGASVALQISEFCTRTSTSRVSGESE